MWSVESTVVVPIVVSFNGLLAKSFDQHFKKLSLGCWIKGRIQQAVVLETARIVRREKLGMYEEDFNSPYKTITPRKSAFIYEEIVRSRILDPNNEPEQYFEERETYKKDSQEKERGKAASDDFI
ncbi:jg11599 [Pararge aegeria aegeria]|uniref:Jg11599 protein n=1 Tax=Pararge aegeria aegeria TaxID=348720 RepID=A0A8S4RS58_9NEOP|nr:jg11599 [Pararge aegeria aegeria]